MNIYSFTDNDVTLQFDLKTDIYGTPDEVKNKLKNSSPFQIFDQTASDPLIFVWTGYRLLDILSHTL